MKYENHDGKKSFSFNLGDVIAVILAVTWIGSLFGRSSRTDENS